MPKEQFRILVILAERSEFHGNLSDMCRYFSVDPQTRHRNRLRSAIKELEKQGFIKAERAGRTYHLTAIPKEEEISMPAAWVKRIRQHDYTSESVAWEVVLKVQLWLIQYAHGTITNSLIATDIGVSDSTVVAAKNVLEREYQAFIKKYDYEIAADGFFMRKGQIINMAAWWT